MSHRRFFSGCLVWLPCFPEFSTRFWRWDSGGKEPCKHAPSTSLPISPEEFHPLCERCGADCLSPPARQTLRERLSRRIFSALEDTCKLLPTSASSANGFLTSLVTAILCVLGALGSWTHLLVIRGCMSCLPRRLRVPPQLRSHLMFFLATSNGTARALKCTRGPST